VLDLLGVCCLLELGWGSFGDCGLVLARVALLLPDLTFAVFVIGDGEDEAAAADFLLCRGGLVVFVLVFALFRTDGALTCRASFAGRAFVLELALGLATRAAVVEVLPDDTPQPTWCLDCPVSGLVLRSLVLDSTPELSLSAFRRAGFFLGFLVVALSEGC
jgi:hypothetical protein